MAFVNKIIGIDFDGTIVTHEYPNIGKPVPHALETIREIQRWGNRIILYTMRSGDKLQEAIDYCTENGIQLWAANENPDQHTWTSSPKVYCHVYIDDAALMTPLIYNEEYTIRPYVDWKAIQKQLMEWDFNYMFDE
jgi:hydroxymethylpyrimidine pyrophosphatase-like HAD family hydrolase